MASTSGYAVWLFEDLPKEFLSVFEGWTVRSRVGTPVNFLAATECEQVGAFLSLTILRKDEKPWRVQIPLSCVVAITEIEDVKKRKEFGFN